MMILFLLIFEVIILFITVLCHKMVKIRHREIEESMRIFTDTRAYRTNSKVCFIEDIIKRYKQYISIKGETPILETMIEGELYKYNIGRFSFVGVNNIALKSKIIMRYAIGFQIMIMIINNQIKSIDCIIMLFLGVIITIGTEIFTIISALDKKESVLICHVKDYIIHKYPVELYNRENNKQISNKRDNIKLEGNPNSIHKDDISDSSNNEYTKCSKKNSKLTSRDIEDMIISIELNRGEIYSK